MGVNFLLIWSLYVVDWVHFFMSCCCCWLWANTWRVFIFLVCPRSWWSASSLLLWNVQCWDVCPVGRALVETSVVRRRGECSKNLGCFRSCIQTARFLQSCDAVCGPFAIFKCSDLWLLFVSKDWQLYGKSIKEIDICWRWQLLFANLGHSCKYGTQFSGFMGIRGANNVDTLACDLVSKFTVWWLRLFVVFLRHGVLPCCSGRFFGQVIV